MIPRENPISSLNQEDLMDFFSYSNQMLLIDLVFAVYAVYDFSFFMFRGPASPSSKAKGLITEDFDLLGHESKYQKKQDKSNRKVS